MHLRTVQLKKTDPTTAQQFPLTIPLIQSLSRLDFTAPVTFFVGENGTGKSTVLEALAAAIGSITVGAESVQTDPTLIPARRLARQMKLSWTVRTNKGFFLRAEDFVNFARRISELRSEMLENIAQVEVEYADRSAYARALAMAPYKKSIAEMESRYGEDLDANSHGESFFKLFHSRFVPGGLYLLDEPESPLSPMKQLAFLAMLKEMVAQDSQFIIATHSPILMAYPGAEIWNFDELPVKPIAYNDLEHVNLTKSFLNDPERYLRHL